VTTKVTIQPSSPPKQPQPEAPSSNDYEDFASSVAGTINAQLGGGEYVRYAASNGSEILDINPDITLTSGMENEIALDLARGASMFPGASVTKISDTEYRISPKALSQPATAPPLAASTESPDTAGPPIFKTFSVSDDSTLTCSASTSSATAPPIFKGGVPDFGEGYDAYLARIFQDAIRNNDFDRAIAADAKNSTLSPIWTPSSGTISGNAIYAGIVPTDVKGDNLAKLMSVMSKNTASVAYDFPANAMKTYDEQIMAKHMAELSFLPQITSYLDYRWASSDAAAQKATPSRTAFIGGFLQNVTAEFETGHDTGNPIMTVGAGVNAAIGGTLLGDVIGTGLLSVGVESALPSFPGTKDIVQVAQDELGIEKIEAVNSQGYLPAIIQTSVVTGRNVLEGAASELISSSINKRPFNPENAILDAGAYQLGAEAQLLSFYALTGPQVQIVGSAVVGGAVTGTALGSVEPNGDPLKYGAIGAATGGIFGEIAYQSELSGVKLNIGRMFVNKVSDGVIDQETTGLQIAANDIDTTTGEMSSYGTTTEGMLNWGANKPFIVMKGDVMVPGGITEAIVYNDPDALVAPIEAEKVKYLTDMQTLNRAAGLDWSAGDTNLLKAYQGANVVYFQTPGYASDSLKLALQSTLGQDWMATVQDINAGGGTLGGSIMERQIQTPLSTAIDYAPSWEADVQNWNYPGPNRPSILADIPGSRASGVYLESPPQFATKDIDVQLVDQTPSSDTYQNLIQKAMPVSYEGFPTNAMKYEGTVLTKFPDIDTGGYFIGEEKADITVLYPSIFDPTPPSPLGQFALSGTRERINLGDGDSVTAYSVYQQIATKTQTVGMGAADEAVPLSVPMVGSVPPSGLLASASGSGALSFGSALSLLRSSGSSSTGKPSFASSIGSISKSSSPSLPSLSTSSGSSSSPLSSSSASKSSSSSSVSSLSSSSSNKSSSSSSPSSSSSSSLSSLSSSSSSSSSSSLSSSSSSSSSLSSSSSSLSSSSSSISPPPFNPPTALQSTIGFKRKRHSLKLPKLRIGDKSTIRSDLISSGISQSKYGKATSPNPTADIYKRFAVGGVIPTVEMRKRNERQPVPSLIKGIRGLFKRGKP
jgi:hypothetical protein